MKITRRLLSLLLAVVLTAGVIPSAIIPTRATGMDSWPAAVTVPTNTTGSYTVAADTNGDDRWETNLTGYAITYLNSSNCNDYKIAYTKTATPAMVGPGWNTSWYNKSGVWNYYAANGTGDVNGITNIIPSNAKEQDDNGEYYRVVNEKKYYLKDIVLGITPAKFNKGVSMPLDATTAETPNYVSFDISNLDAEYFHAVVGCTYPNLKTASGGINTCVVFQLYGSAAEKATNAEDFKLLAQTESISRLETAEFNVKLPDNVKTLKLVATYGSRSGFTNKNAQVYVAWANACVYSTPKMSVSTQVNWADEPNGDTSRRPSKIKVQLYAGETAYGEEVTLNAENEWKYEWTKLPNAAYTVKSNTASTDYYDISMTGNNVTATYNRVNLSSAVTWDDNSNQYSKRPSEVTVQLYADGSALDGKTIALNEANGWAGAFSDLPKYNADGSVIAYSVNVTAPDYYTAEVNGTAITLKCTFDPNKETTSCSTSLTWVGDDEHLSERHTHVDIQLYADGVAVDGKTAALNAENSFSHTFEGLAKYQENSTTEIVYSVVVTTAQKFYNFTVADGAITATYIPMATVDIPVEVVFDDSDNAMKLRPETVTAQLYANGEKVDGKTLTLSADNNWTGAWTGLNRWLADRSADIVYTVKAEPAVAQYTESYADGKLNLKCEPKSNVVASVTWDHGENTAVPASLDVNLYRNNVWVEKQTLNPENNWTYTWEDLPMWDETNKVALIYSVFAAAPTDYLITNDNGKITLTYHKSNAVKVSNIGAGSYSNYKGIPAAATDCKTFYLTDLLNGNNSRLVSQYIIDGGSYKSFVNYEGQVQLFYGSSQTQVLVTEPGTHNGVDYKPTDIVLGAQGKKFLDGISAMASPATGNESYIIFNLSGMNLNQFYAVAGITGTANDKLAKACYLTFEVWGSTDGVNFVKLAYADAVRSYLMAEFNVDITGYNYLKLVTRNTGTTNAGAAFAWADACVYTTSSTPAPNPNPNPDPEPDPEPEITAPYNYTASVDGTYTGIKAKDGKVTYLSEKSETDATKGKYITGYYVVPGGGSSEVRYPTLDTAFGKTTNIIIGAKDAEFTHGLGVLPSHGTSTSDKQNYILLDISGIADVDRFYAVAGMTGTGKNKAGENFASVFEVWGSKNVTTDPADASFELLAVSTDLYAEDSGEFNVNIEGYKTLKLAIFAAENNPGKANSNIQSAWAEACVYKYDANGSAPEIPGDGEEEGPLPGVYTGSTDGSYKWITDAKDGKVTYLSGLNPDDSVNSSSNAPTTKNYPYGEPAKKIIIGSKNTMFTYGLGVHPKSGSGVAYTIYDLTGLDVDRFYAAVGITNEKGKSGNSQGVIFEVYVDYDGNGTYKQLAESDVIVLKNTGEFHCDITGAKTLKLVVMSATGDHASSASTWANACVYKYDANGSAPASNTTTGASNSTGGSTGPADNTGLKPIDGFIASVDGEYAGVPKEKGKSIVYLSDLDYQSASNTTNSAHPHGQPTTLDHPYNSLSELITLGEMDRVFFKGLGMHPKDPKNPMDGTIDSWTIYDVSELDCDRFYAAVGLSNEKGKAGASKGVIFKVYADYTGNGSYKLLSHSGCLDGRESGEFDLDITGVKTLKLVTVCASTTHTSSAAAWGNTCVYNSKYVPEETEPTETTETVETVEPTEVTEATAPTEVTEDPGQSAAPTVIVISSILLLLIAAAIIVLLMLKKKAKV